MPSEFFSSIKTAATSPYALIAYLCLLAAWASIAARGLRLRQISKVIGAVPEMDRAALLVKEYNTTPRQGLSAEQWMRSRKQLLLFLAFIALVVAIAVVAVTAMLVPTKSTTLPGGPTLRDPLNKEESPFAVSVEWAMFSYGGKGYGTGFWLVSSLQNSCTISPIQAVFFFRVKNVRSIPVTLIGYSLDVQGVPLIRAHMGSIVRVQPKGSIGARFPNGYPIGKSINFGQGPGFSMVHLPNDDGDFTQALLLQMDPIENLLKTPLQPNMPIRGWAFYQSPNENAFTVAGPGHITLETDDSRTFSYDFNLRNPHPELDILDRVMTAKSVIDLSNCERP